MRYEKWSLGYWFLKQYVSFAYWIILKKTLVTGKDKIPKDKPIVIAPNHQNALSDPMAVLLNTRFQPVWLARADIFGKNRLIDSILKFMKIIPVYRLRDGKENLDKNQDTFSISKKVLENNFALALFPEAAHTFKRQMMPHKKAVPRIVFMAEEQTDNKLDIQIIPTGIFYSSYWKFNRTLIVQFGEPIPVKKYLETYLQNEKAATINLKKDLFDAILPLVINIKSQKYYKDFELIREIYGEFFLLRQKKKKTTLNLFNSNQLLVHMLDELERNFPDQTKQVVSLANDYHRQIKPLGLRSWVVTSKKILQWKITGNLMLLLAGFPLFVYGFIFNVVPFFLIDRLVRKKIKDKSFWSSFFLVAGIFFFPLYYLILAFFMFLIKPSFFIVITTIVSLPFAGKFSFKWYILLRKTMGLFRFQKLKWFKKEIYNQVISQKNQLFEELNALLPVR